MFFLLTESASPSQQESLLGSWCMAAHDIDRSIAASALRSWKAALSYPGDPQADQKHLLLDDRLWSSLLSFIQRAALDPSGIYQYLNPTPPVAPSPAPGRGSGKPNLTATSWKGDSEPTSRSKGDEMDEGEQDRGARLRIGAFGALRWALGMLSTCLVLILIHYIVFRNIFYNRRGVHNFPVQSRFMDCFISWSSMPMARDRKFRIFTAQCSEIGMGPNTNITYVS